MSGYINKIELEMSALQKNEVAPNIDKMVESCLR